MEKQLTFLDIMIDFSKDVSDITSMSNFRQTDRYKFYLITQSILVTDNSKSEEK